MPAGTKQEGSGKEAFLLGAVAGIAVVLLCVYVTLWGSKGLAGMLQVLGVPAGNLVWSAILALQRPKAPKAAVPLGYACVCGLLGLVLSGDVAAVPAVVLFSALIFLVGYLGQVAARRCFRRRFPLDGPAGEPTCPRCGYVLYHVQNHLCPECGVKFLVTEVDMRLAKWEDGVLKPRSSEDVSDALPG